MLVLSRKRHEKIVIGDEITVTVLEVHGDQVQLGIEAPRHITVHRHEIYEAIQRGEQPRDASPAKQESSAGEPDSADESAGSEEPNS